MVMEVTSEAYGSLSRVVKIDSSSMNSKKSGKRANCPQDSFRTL